MTPILLDDTLTRDELREANAYIRIRRERPRVTAITRRYTWDEALLAIKHIRYDFGPEPAKAILYSLLERFRLTVTGPEYAISYDNGDGMFWATFRGVTGAAILLHERSAGRCWCIPMADVTGRHAGKEKPAPPTPRPPKHEKPTPPPKPAK